MMQNGRVSALPFLFGVSLIDLLYSTPQFSQNCLKPWGQLAFHRYPFPGGGVGEGQPSRVEALACQAGKGLAAVDLVAQKRVAGVGHMYPDLVCAACLQAA